jgi:hypothetical protein
MPQKQPPAITAVCFPEAAALAWSTTGLGTGTLAPLPALQATTPAKRISNIANMRTEILDIRFPPSSTTTRKLPLHYQSYENGESFGCFGAAPKYITVAGQPPAAF